MFNISLLGNIIKYTFSRQGRPMLVYQNFVYYRYNAKLWRCIHCRKNLCKVYLSDRGIGGIHVFGTHTHDEDYDSGSKANKQRRQKNYTQIATTLRPRRLCTIKKQYPANNPLAMVFIPRLPDNIDLTNDTLY